MNNFSWENALLAGRYIYSSPDDPNSKVLLVERWEDAILGGKTFLFKKQNASSQWIKGKPKELISPYRFHDWKDQPEIIFVEGEKCAEEVIHMGLKATAIPGGANAWKGSAQAFRPFFEKKKVYLLPDNDEPGHRFAGAVSASLKDIASKVVIVNLPGLGHKEDVVEWRARGGTREKLVELCKQAEDTMAEALPIHPIHPKNHHEKALAFRASLKLAENEAMGVLTWSGRVHEYHAGKYQAVLDGQLEAKALRFLQLNLSHEKNTISDRSNLIANLKALTNLPDFPEPPFWIKELPDPDQFLCIQDGLLNVDAFIQNGKFDLGSHSPDYFTLQKIDWPVGPEAGCPLWMKFLHEVIPNEHDRLMLQEWFGYNLVPTTRFEKSLVMQGEGANGKSVICVVLKTLLGEDNVSHLSIEGLDERRSFQLASTVGKLANISTDLNEVDKAAEGTLKKIVCGESMCVERKHAHPFMMKPTVKLTFASNSNLHFSDSTDGIWRRFLYLRFHNQVLDPKRQNRNLADQSWWIKSGEIPSVFRWSLEGLKRLYNNNTFTISEQMTRDIQALRENTNSAKTFLKTYCIGTSPEKSLRSRSLYLNYKSHCDAMGIRPKSAQSFAAEVMRTFQESFLSEHAHTDPQHAAKRSRIWYGVAWVEGVAPYGDQ